MNKKSQAALEFLTTYAWAFLVILIMIGALAYFGVLKPTSIFPAACTFASEFGCIDYAIKAESTELANDGIINVKLRNNVGETVKVDAEKATLTTPDGTAVACIVNPPASTLTWGRAANQTFSWTGCDTGGASLVSGDKGKVLVKIEFYITDPTYVRIAEGEVFSSVT